MELSTLVKMSNTYGSNPAYVLAGGGNTSVKDDTTLYVKGSGTQLATIKAEEFVKMDRARLNEIMKTEYPAGRDQLHHPGDGDGSHECHTRFQPDGCGYRTAVCGKIQIYRKVSYDDG